MSPTAATRFAGVIGAPVRHSLSPVIHNAWLEAAGIDAVYVAFEPPPLALRRTLEGLAASGCLGLNVTIPFKEEALSLAQSASAAAKAAGAANLLVFRTAEAAADNTDGFGLLLALSEAGFAPEGRRAVVLGGGGAARGAALALIGAGATAVTLVNRTLARAEQVAVLDPRLEARAWDDAPAAMSGADLLINATSLGMNGQPPLQLELGALPAGAVVMDMVYGPLDTPLLKAARERGLVTVDGLAMLIAQARPSFQAIFGRAPPAEVDVRALCEAALAK